MLECVKIMVANRRPIAVGREEKTNLWRSQHGFDALVLDVLAKRASFLWFAKTRERQNLVLVACLGDFGKSDAVRVGAVPPMPILLWEPLALPKH